MDKIKEESKKIASKIKKYENLMGNEEEKRTVSIRLSASTIEKLDKEVEKLKKTGKIARKFTISSYVSKIIDLYALNELEDLK